MMWKILTAQIREDICMSRTFLEEQKVCDKETRGACDLMYTDQHILKESKARLKNEALTWIDYKKANDILPQFWIVDCRKVYKICDKVIEFITEDIKTGKWNRPQVEKI